LARSQYRNQRSRQAAENWDGQRALARVTGLSVIFQSTVGITAKTINQRISHDTSIPARIAKSHRIDDQAASTRSKSGSRTLVMNTRYSVPDNQKAA